MVKRKLIMKKATFLGKAEAGSEEIVNDILYDACNSMARDANENSNIKESLDYMLLALLFVQDWEYQDEKYEGAMKVTVLSELYLNIANAQLYLDQPNAVRASATRAIAVAKRFIESASKKLEELRRSPASSQEEH